MSEQLELKPLQTNKEHLGETVLLLLKHMSCFAPDHKQQLGLAIKDFLWSGSDKHLRHLCDVMKYVQQDMESLSRFSEDDVRQFHTFTGDVWALINACKKSGGIKHWIGKKHQRNHPLLRFWELFSFMLPPKLRREVYEPAYNDLLADFLIALRYRSKWAKRWLWLCFRARTGYMVAECIRVCISAKLRKLIVDSVADLFRRG